MGNAFGPRLTWVLTVGEGEGEEEDFRRDLQGVRASG